MGGRGRESRHPPTQNVTARARLPINIHNVRRRDDEGSACFVAVWRLSLHWSSRLHSAGTVSFLMSLFIGFMWNVATEHKVVMLSNSRVHVIRGVMVVGCGGDQTEEQIIPWFKSRFPFHPDASLLTSDIKHKKQDGKWHENAKAMNTINLRVTVVIQAQEEFWGENGVF